MGERICNNLCNPFIQARPKLHGRNCTNFVDGIDEIQSANVLSAFQKKHKALSIKTPILFILKSLVNTPMVEFWLS